MVGFVVLAIGGLGVEGLNWVEKYGGVAHFAEVGVEEGIEMLGVTILALPGLRVLAYVMSSEPDAGPGTGA